MKSEKKPPNTIFYGSYKDMIYNASPQEVKEIMVAFCEYAFDHKTPKVSPNISLVWGIIKGNIDKDHSQYSEKCRKNSENAKKRYSSTVTYTIGDNEYELIFPKRNKDNVIGEKEFSTLFGEIEDDHERYHRHLTNFIAIGNDDEWEKPYKEYEAEIWSDITKEDNS